MIPPMQTPSSALAKLPQVDDRYTSPQPEPLTTAFRESKKAVPVLHQVYMYQLAANYHVESPHLSRLSSTVTSNMLVSNSTITQVPVNHDSRSTSRTRGDRNSSQVTKVSQENMKSYKASKERGRTMNNFSQSDSQIANSLSGGLLSTDSNTSHQDKRATTSSLSPLPADLQSVIVPLTTLRSRAPSPKRTKSSMMLPLQRLPVPVLSSSGVHRQRSSSLSEVDYYPSNSGSHSTTIPETNVLYKLLNSYSTTTTNNQMSRESGSQNMPITEEEGMREDGTDKRFRFNASPKRPESSLVVPTITESDTTVQSHSWLRYISSLISNRFTQVSGTTVPSPHPSPKATSSNIDISLDDIQSLPLLSKSLNTIPPEQALSCSSDIDTIVTLNTQSTIEMSSTTDANLIRPSQNSLPEQNMRSSVNLLRRVSFNSPHPMPSQSQQSMRSFILSPLEWNDSTVQHWAKRQVTLTDSSPSNRSIQRQPKDALDLLNEVLTTMQIELRDLNNECEMEMDNRFEMDLRIEHCERLIHDIKAVDESLLEQLGRISQSIDTCVSQ